MEVNVKYKIQIPGVLGWGDLKVPSEGDEFETELYDTKEEAQSELKFMADRLDDFEGRVVASTVEEDANLY